MDREQFLQLKPGDMVRVRSYEDMLKDSIDSSKTPKFNAVHQGEIDDESYRFIPPMRKYCGQILTISQAANGFYHEIVYCTDTPDNPSDTIRFRFTKEMLERVTITANNFEEMMK